MKRPLSLWALLAALLVGGCRQAERLAPLAQAPLPTATPGAPAASSETLPPPATSAQPAPPAAPTALPLPTPPVLAPEPTPAPSGPALPRLGPDAIPPGVNPLTGLPFGAGALSGPPIAIKVSNSGPVVRPQSGLNSADMVFEHYAEGGITRFTALFYGQGAPLVGPIRSARLIDLEIPKMYGAAFAYSGSSGPVRELIRASAFFDRVISPDFGSGAFWRDSAIGNPNKPAWETMYTDTNTLQFQLAQRGLASRPTLPTHLLFDAAAPPGGSPATTVEFQYQATNVFWRYDAASGRYLRWADGQPHVDANTGAQLSSRNVVALSANHVESTILEDEVGGGHYGSEIQLWGEGPASVFRDGLRFEGRWVRNDPGEMVLLYDVHGQLLPLSPGNTFFQLVPLGFADLRTTP